jgi:hypothetical protein
VVFYFSGHQHDPAGWVKALAMERETYKRRAKYQRRGVLGDLGIALLQATAQPRAQIREDLPGLRHAGRPPAQGSRGRCRGHEAAYCARLRHQASALQADRYAPGATPGARFQRTRSTCQSRDWRRCRSLRPSLQVRKNQLYLFSRTAVIRRRIVFGSQSHGEWRMEAITERR